MTHVALVLILLMALLRTSCLQGANSSTPGRYEIVATLNLPDEAWLSHPFRASLLYLPHVYVLDRTGDLYVFEISDELEQKPQPIRVRRDVGDGSAMIIVRDFLYLTRRGRLEVYSLNVPENPRHLGTFGPPAIDFLTHAIVPAEKRLFLLGRDSISAYDLTARDAPQHLMTARTGRDAFDGCIARGLLYVADAGLKDDDSGGIAAFDVSNPMSIQEVAFAAASHVPFHITAIADDRLLLSQDSDQRSHTITNQHVTVNGNAAVFQLDAKGVPLPVKAFQGSGGRVSTVLRCGDGIDFICGGLIFEVGDLSLSQVFSFFPEGLSTADGQPYHGDAKGRHAALTGDSAVVILRRAKCD